MDPISLLMFAVSAAQQIKKGCEMLREGKAEIDKFKKTVEGGVKDARAIYKEVTGLWGWLKSLFGKPAPTVPSVKTAEPVKSKKTREPDPTAEELQVQVINSVGEQLGVFFDVQQKLTHHYKTLEETSTNVYDPNQNHAKAAVERALVELQLENLGTEIREAMVYAPKELKDIYTRFLKMYGKIQEEQEFARKQQVRKARIQAWRRRVLKDFLVDQAMALISVGILVLIVWGMLLGIALPSKTPTSFL